MSTEFRALMAEMAAELDHNRRCLLDDASLTHPLGDRARYLLAKPADGPAVPEGREPASVAEQPSDEEWNHASWDDLAELFNRHCCEVGDEGVGIVAKDVPAFARAVLARLGQPPAPPAERHAAPAPPGEGEVAELVAWLREEAAEQSPGDSDALPSDVRDCLAAAAARLTRAAELLERHAVPVPLPAPQGGEVGA